MHKIGDYVYHTHCGVCQIKDIAVLSGDHSGNQYYVLTPLYGDDKNNIVRVPVSNPVSLRRPLDREGAIALIQSWPSADNDFYILDSKKRKAAYEAAFQSGLIEDLAMLLEGALQRKRRDVHLNSMDSQFVNRASPIVYGELSFALGIPYEEVVPYLESLKKVGK